MVAELYGGPRDGLVLDCDSIKVVHGAWIEVPVNWIADRVRPGETFTVAEGVEDWKATYEIVPGWKRHGRQMFAWCPQVR